MGGRVNKLRSKKSSKTIDIVRFPLEVSVSGVTCVFVVHFRSSDISGHFKVGKLAEQLTSVCPPKHV